MKNTLYVAMLLILAPLVTAEALLVTVTYDHETFTLSHAELISGEPAVDSNGQFILAYDTPTGVKPVTRLNVPVLESRDDGMHVLDHVEYTLVIPWISGATNIGLYADTAKVASLPLISIKEIGDTAGSPPAESLAARAGQKSTTKTLVLLDKGDVVTTQLKAIPTYDPAGESTGSFGTGTFIVLLLLLGAGIWYFVRGRNK